jgi:hypothetical protein
MKTRFSDFRDAIAAGTGPDDPRCVVASDARFTLIYAPFSYVTPTARLAIVGQTSGPSQLALAYPEVRSKLAMGRSENEIVRAALEMAAFGGRMREPLLRMLRHFGIGDLIGVPDVASLWISPRGPSREKSNAHLLHSTSIVPHAAFRRSTGERFSDNEFQTVLKSPLLRRCFEECFLPQLAELPSGCPVIGLGPLVYEGLKWCVERGHLKSGQLLGGLPHPSTASGKQVGFFLKEIPFEALSSVDRVHRSVARLRRDYDEFLANVEAWRRENLRGATAISSAA